VRQLFLLKISGVSIYAFETELGKELLKEAGYEGEYIGVGSCILGYPKEGFPKPIERKSNFYKIIR